MSLNETYAHWIKVVGALVDDADHQRMAGLGKSYALVTNGVDQHGALEWTFYSKALSADQLDRLVSIAVVPATQDEAHLEFVFGGRLRDQFVRRIASSQPIKSDHLRAEQFLDWLGDAVKQANSVTEEDLASSLHS